MTAVRKNFLAALRRWSTEGNRFMKIATRAAASAAAVGIAASGMLSLAVGTAAADPVGPGCAQYSRQVPSGPGSVMGMAADPVAVAAANNPLLKTLTAALSGQLNPKVNLVDTLNGGQFTVFAPTDDAFAELPSATIDSLKTDSAALTSILTYHKTVQGATLTVTGTPDALKVNDASVICDGVNTANATVYLIDTVLMPPAH